jgi:hypothetical protein
VVGDPPVPGLKVKAAGRLDIWPSGFLTVTSTTAADSAGVAARRSEELAKATDLAATLPNDTPEPLWKPVPAIFTAVPPVVDPELGETLLTFGGRL